MKEFTPSSLKQKMHIKEDSCVFKFCLRMSLLLLFILNFSNSVNAQNEWHEKYLECVHDSDIHVLKNLIEQWEKVEPQSPDVYAAWYNYYVKLAKDDVVALTKVEPKGNQETLMLADSTGAIAGYLYSANTYNDSIMQIAYNKLDDAIRLFPDRLDLPFGKITVLLQQERYPDVMQVLHQVIEQSKNNGNKWLWTLNQPLDDAEDIFKDSMQDYFIQLFDDGQSNDAQQLIEWLLQLYSKDIMFRADKASILAISERYSEALPIYLSIYKDDPNDIIVTSNIAHIYYIQGDKKATLKYYSKLVNCGDSEIEEVAQKRIKEIKGE